MHSLRSSIPMYGNGTVCGTGQQATEDEPSSGKEPFGIFSVGLLHGAIIPVISTSDNLDSTGQKA
jgi:hypothetical protein